jgi:exopolysaccharide biosynthesis polyprenyl glycosylphosphotransferase
MSRELVRFRAIADLPRTSCVRRSRAIVDESTPGLASLPERGTLTRPRQGERNEAAGEAWDTEGASVATVGAVRARARVVRRLGALTPAYQPWWYVGALAAGDVFAAAAGLATGLIVMPDGTESTAVPFLMVAMASWPLLLAVRGAYGLRALGVHDDFARVSRWAVEFIAVLAVVTVVFDLPLPRSAAVAAIPVMLVGSLLTRYLVRLRLRTVRRRGKAVRRVLAVGTGHGITTFLDRLSASVEHEVVVVGACAEGPGRVVEDIPLLTRLPDARLGEEVVTDDEAVHAVLTAIDNVRADTVCVTGCSLFGGDRLRALTWALADRGVELLTVSGLVNVERHRMQIGNAGGATLLHVYPVRVSGVRALTKHAFDRAVAAVGLVVLSPILLTVGLVVRLDSPGPAIYRQTRLGINGRPFTMFKFRTMVDNAETELADLVEVNEQDGLMFKVRNDPRTTTVGHLLRRLSLDELPQLVNVLRGEMSLVGPRPPLPEEVAEYRPVELRRLLVRPGMTGLWQVSGRSDLSWDETVRLDLRYIDNWSLGQDCSLLWRTGRAVIKGTGAY